jgi:MoaA/NifB/PqqE/SkfB family radical SAM enzyme
MRNCGEILPGDPVVQIFRATEDYLCGVAVLIATYGTNKLNSDISLEIFRAGEPFSAIAQRSINLSAVYDNSFVELFFEPEVASRDLVYLIRISSDNASHKNAATLYLSDGIERIAGHIECRANGMNSEADGIYAKPTYAPPVTKEPVPPNLEISLVTQCNLNCVHCISRETRKSANHLRQSVRDDLSTWARDGRLQTAYTDFSGDILWADQKFGGELAFFIDLDIPFHLDTNGTHLTREVADRLLTSKVTSINISIDAARAETYKRIRKGSPPLDTIFSNMRTLWERRSVLGREDIKLSAAFVLMRSNIAELPEFVRRVHAAGFDTVRTIHMQAYTADMEAESLWFDQKTFNDVRLTAIEVADALGIELFIDRAFDDRDDQIGTSFCSLPWKAAYLLGNGDVLACCVPGLRMGNVYEEPMEAIWNGPKYQELRRTVNSNAPPPSCLACPFNRKTNNPLSYTPHRVIHGQDYIPTARYSIDFAAVL